MQHSYRLLISRKVRTVLRGGGKRCRNRPTDVSLVVLLTWRKALFMDVTIRGSSLRLLDHPVRLLRRECARVESTIDSCNLHLRESAIAIGMRPTPGTMSNT